MMTQQAPNGNPPAGGAPPAPASSAPPVIDLSTMFVPGSGDLGAVDETEEEDNPTVGAQNEPEGDTPPGGPAPSLAPTPAPAPDATQAALLETVKALTARVAQPAPAQPAPAPKAEEPRVWVTPEQIPQAMSQLLTSEDPAERVRGLAVFANALAGLIYTQFQKDVTEQYQPQFETMVRDHYQQQAQIQEFRNEMQRDYPILVNSDAGRLVGQHLIQQISAEFTAQGKAANWYDPAFKQALNAKLKAMNLDPKKGMIKAQQQQQQEQKPNPPPAKVGRGNGARAVDPTPGNSQLDHMMSVLGTMQRGTR